MFFFSEIFAENMTIEAKNISFDKNTNTTIFEKNVIVKTANKIIKSEFAKGFRNIELVSQKDSNETFKIETSKEYYKFEILKDDFQDIIALAEENASIRKLFKKDCNRIELVDIQTID